MADLAAYGPLVERAAIADAVPDHVPRPIDLIQEFRRHRRLGLVHAVHSPSHDALVKVAQRIELVSAGHPFICPTPAGLLVLAVGIDNQRLGIH
jgi:hypothetical protein